MARSSSARKAGWPGGEGAAGWAHQGAAPRSWPHLQEGRLPWRARGRVRIGWPGRPAPAGSGAPQPQPGVHRARALVCGAAQSEYAGLLVAADGAAWAAARASAL